MGYSDNSVDSIMVYGVATGIMMGFLSTCLEYDNNSISETVSIFNVASKSGLGFQLNLTKNIICGIALVGIITVSSVQSYKFLKKYC